MKIAVVRHGIAEDKEKFKKTGKSDTLRKLTAVGKTRMRQNAKGIRALLPKIELIATSPLTRAEQTAAILKKNFPKSKVAVTDVLTPHSSPVSTLRWLQKNKKFKTVAIVGHEPQLSKLVSFLTFHQSKSKINLKKGGLCVLEFPNAIEAGAAQIECLIQPQTLRNLRN